MPPPRPRGAPTTGERPRIISRTVIEAKPLQPIPPLYQKRGIYRVEERADAQNRLEYWAINAFTGEVVRQITFIGIHHVYIAPSIKRLRQVMHERMGGWREWCERDGKQYWPHGEMRRTEEGVYVHAVSDLRAVQGVAGE